MSRAQLSPWNALLICAALLVSSGCATETETASRAETESINAADFRGPDDAPNRERVAADQTTQSSDRSATRTTSDDSVEDRAIALVGGPNDIAPPPPGSDTASNAQPDALRTAKAQQSTTKDAADPLIVDRMVGQINGNPLYASEFFRDMDARLRAEAQKRDAREWLSFAADQIRQELGTRIRDELLLAEFQSALSPEERQGVLGFLQFLREDVLRRNRGSEAIADSELRRREGLSLGEYLEREKERRFIGEQVRREINSRVNVSYRDIKRRYQRDREQYEPMPVAVLRVIRVRASDTAAREAVAEALESGAPPEQIAREHGRFNREENGLKRVALENRDYESQEFFPPPELNDPTQSLGVGETAGPIEYGSSIYWVHLEAIDQPEKQSLYDVQLRIERELEREFTQEVQQRYFGRVYERGSFTDIEEMQQQLLQFAAERYLIAPQVNGRTVETGSFGTPDGG